MGPKHVARYTQIISKASAWTLLITIVILSLVPAQYRPTVGLPRLVEHFSIFFVTGLVFGVGYPQRRLFQFVALPAFTAAIELAQLLVPGRHARLSDFLIDACAVTVGLWIGSRRRRDERAASQSRCHRATHRGRLQAGA
jgi:VanZ family protein